MQTCDAEGPGRGAAAAAVAAPAILMRIQQDEQSATLSNRRNVAQVSQIFLVEHTGIIRLHRLPRDHEPHEREAPGCQSCEMLLGLGEGEGSAREAGCGVRFF